MHCTPNNGGCWYCHTDDGLLTFCSEFDTFLHTECIEKRAKEAEERDEYDPELEIIRREFGY